MKTETEVICQKNFGDFRTSKKGGAEFTRQDSNFRHTTSRKGRHLGKILKEGSLGQLDLDEFVNLQIFVPRKRADT